VVKSLDRKLLRDLSRMKGQVTAIIVIVICGVASWVSVLSTWRGLVDSRDAYYREYRMPDVFAPVKKAPARVAERLERVPGVRRVRARISFDVTIDVEGVDEPCVGRVLGLPEDDRRSIGGVHLTKGNWFSGRGEREVIVGDRFAKEHGLEPGDLLSLVMNDRKQSLRIVATALSPEYVYMIRGAADLLPDPDHFTALWVGDTFAEAVFDFEDSANEFLATLTAEADERAVVAAFDEELDRYGRLGAYGLADQVSNQYLTNEIEGLKGTATMVPTIFLGVAAFVLNMLLGRLVRTQRTVIALFRAFGHGTAAIAAHYLKFALLIGGLGCLAGTGLGLWFGAEMLEVYQEFYTFPVMRFPFEWEILLSGALVSLAFSALGALSASRSAARIQPAEGLRPEAPGVYRPTVVERWRWLWRHLGFSWRMVIRNVRRARLRSMLTVSVVAVSASILLLAMYMDDSIRALATFQYEKIERQDVRVAFGDEKGRAALYELRRLPGVRRAEPELVVPVDLVNGHRKKRTGITGIWSESRLRGFVDRRRRPVPRPVHGLVLSSKLAEILAVEPGGTVEVRVLTGRKQEFRATVEGTIDEYIGTNAYADLDALSRWIDEESVLTSAVLLADGARTRELARTLKNLPAVESVAFTEQTREVFDETLAASIGIMTGILTFFAGVISFGVIYNASRIALAERERSLASMRVLGFTETEVARVLSRENLLLAVLAIPFGLGLGLLFCWALVVVYDTELFRFPFFVSPGSLAFTAAGVVGFAVVANLAIRRRIRKLEIVEVLKSRE